MPIKCRSTTYFIGDPDILSKTCKHEPPALEKIADMFCHDTPTWERLLWTSGGLLNPLKCVYYNQAWKFDAEDRPGPIPKEEAPVTQLNSNETHRYLGNILPTDMQMKDACTALLRTSRSFASGILCSNLSKQDSWVAYFCRLRSLRCVQFAHYTPLQSKSP
jgi:hypothetical protein